MVTGLDFVEHGHGKVGVRDDGFSTLVHGQLFAAQDVLAGALALSLEVASGGNVGPADVVALTQLSQRSAHRKSERFEGLREVRALRNGQAVLGVQVEAAGPTHN